MPELPEVETVCRSLRPHLVGRTINRIRVIEPRLRRPIDQCALLRLVGRRITGVGRKGKYILIGVTGGRVWVFHLGMSGKLICVDSKTPLRKHDHLVVCLDRDRELRYHDPRRFGICLTGTAEEIADLPQLRALGMDALDEELDGEYLFRHTRSSRRRIRDLLLDQQIVAGLGNIYANETLFLAGVKPSARACGLTRNQAHRIADAIPRLLTRAIRWCGTSFSDYRDANDQQGAFQRHLRVYNREGESCVCGSKIRRIALGNRSAFYCRTCQN